MTGIEGVTRLRLLCAALGVGITCFDQSDRYRNGIDKACSEHLFPISNFFNSNCKDNSTRLLSAHLGDS